MNVEAIVESIPQQKPCSNNTSHVMFGHNFWLTIFIPSRGNEISDS